MTRVERVRAAVAGRAVDRPPFTVWYHFGLQHAPAEHTAQAHLEFLEAYDLDWLKVMNDYSYPMPPGVETLDRAGDLARVEPLDPAATPMAAQLEVIERLARALAGRALVVDTVFNAWNTLRRNVVKDAIVPFMREHPKALERALGAVNESLIRYVRGSLARGAAGIFLSVPASEEFVTREEYERFMRPFDLALLEAGRGAGELHVKSHKVLARDQVPPFDAPLEPCLLHRWAAWENRAQMSRTSAQDAVEAVLRDQGNSIYRGYVRRRLVELAGQDDERVAAWEELERDVPDV